MEETSNILIRDKPNLSLPEANQIKVIEECCRLSRWSPADYQEESEREHSLFLTVERQEEIIGFLVARIDFREGTEPSKSTGFSEADLLNFGVLETFRGKGVGARIFLRLLEELNRRRVETLWLEVRESNEKAIRFYHRRNFQTVQVRKNFYSDPTEDALLMKLKIDFKDCINSSV